MRPREKRHEASQDNHAKKSSERPSAETVGIFRSSLRSVSNQLLYSPGNAALYSNGYVLLDISVSV